MKRFFIVFVSLILCVSLFAVVASAAYEGESAGIRFGDSSVADSNTIVNLQQYPNYIASYLQIYDNDRWILVRDGFVSNWSYSFTADAESEVEFRVSPQCTPTFSPVVPWEVNTAYPTGGFENLAQTEVITLDLTMSIGTNVPSNAAARFFQVRIFYAGGDFTDYDGTFVSANSTNGVRSYVGQFVFRRDMLQGAIGFIPIFNYVRSGSEVQTEFDIDISITKFTLTMPTYLYNDILGLGSGDYIPPDPIKPITPNSPLNPDDIQDIFDREEEILDDSNGLDSLEDAKDRFDNVLSYLMYAAIWLVPFFNLLFSLPIVSQIVEAALYIGLIAFVIGVVGIFIKRKGSDE